MFQSIKDKLSNSKKSVAAAGVAAVGAATQASAAGLLTSANVDTTGATGDITLVIVALVGLGILIMGGRKVLSLMSH